jgi:hypothetical protein
VTYRTSRGSRVTKKRRWRVEFRQRLTPAVCMPVASQAACHRQTVTNLTLDRRPHAAPRTALRRARATRVELWHLSAA